MLNKVTVQNPNFETKSGNAKGTGKPYLFWIQKIWVHCPDQPFPKEVDRMVWPVDKDSKEPAEPPLSVGEYSLTVYVEDITRDGKPRYKSVYKALNEK